MKRLLISLLLWASVNGSVAAQTTLEECRELARNNYPAVRLYGLINATKNCSLHNASMMWLPSIRIEAGSGLNNNSSSIDDLFSNTTDPQLYKYWVEDILHNTMHVLDPTPFSYKVQAEVSQNIYDGGASKLAARYAEAEANYHMSEADVTIEQVYNRVDEIFCSILLLEKRILQNQSQLEVLKTSRDRVSSLLVAGSARPVELDALDAACIESEQQKAALELSLKSFRMALTLLTGKDMALQELLMPSTPLQPFVSQQVLMLERKFDLLSLEEEKIKVACRPRIELVGDAYYGFPNRNIFANITSHTPDLNLLVWLRVSWNLSSLYTRKNKMNIISNKMSQVNIEKDIAKLNINLRNNSIYFEIERLNKCIERDNELVTLRERLRKAAELSFSQGEINADDLISKVNDEYQARLNADIHEIECIRESFKLRQ